jgi:hypothetical protein
MKHAHSCVFEARAASSRTPSPAESMKLTPARSTKVVTPSVLAASSGERSNSAGELQPSSARRRSRKRRSAPEWTSSSARW